MWNEIQEFGGHKVGRMKRNKHTWILMLNALRKKTNNHLFIDTNLNERHLYYFLNHLLVVCPFLFYLYTKSDVKLESHSLYVYTYV